MADAPEPTTLADGLARVGDGRFATARERDVSFPAAGHDGSFALEDGSFWFEHRSAVLFDALRRHPLTGDGPLLDVGGGNGYVARGLREQGAPVILVEPGLAGVQNALARGVRPVVHGTLEDARFRTGAVAGVGLFDVVEHVADPAPLLAECRRVLAPRGRLFVTVPAHGWLWSDADVSACHHRRYTPRSLRRALESAGFVIDELAHFFSFLVVPVLLGRAAPSAVRRLLGSAPEAPEALGERMQERALREHAPGARLRPALALLSSAERALLARRQPPPVGTSLLAVAGPAR